MNRVRTCLAGALGVLLIGLAPQAQAQFDRTGPRVTGNGAKPVAPPPAPPPEVAPVTVTTTPEPPPPAPAKPTVPPVDGALPGGVLGPGDEGVGALIRRPEPAAAELAETSKADRDLSAGAISDAPGGDAGAAPAAKPAPHHAPAHRRHARKPAGDPQS